MAAGATLHSLEPANSSSIVSSRVYASSGRGSQPYVICKHLQVAPGLAIALREPLDSASFLPLPPPWGAAGGLARRLL